MKGSPDREQAPGDKVILPCQLTQLLLRDRVHQSYRDPNLGGDVEEPRPRASHQQHGEHGALDVKNKLILISLVVAGACVASVCAFLYFEAAIAFFDRINMSWFGVKAATGGAFRVYAVAVVAGSISGAYLAIAFGARIARHPDRTGDAGAILASFVVAALIVAFAVVTAGDAAGSAIDYFGWPFLVALFGYVGLVVWLKHITAGTSEPGGMSR